MSEARKRLERIRMDAREQGDVAFLVKALDRTMSALEKLRDSGLFMVPVLCELEDLAEKP